MKLENSSLLAQGVLGMPHVFEGTDIISWLIK